VAVRDSRSAEAARATLASRWPLPPRPSFLEDRPLSTAALALARERHAGQRRAADSAPFVLHPLEVAALLHVTGAPDHVVAAGMLHDLLEKTDSDSADIEVRCGRRVSDLVEAVSENPRIRDRRARKAALRRQVRDASVEAALVFAADKVSKVRELRLRMVSGELAEVTEKLEHYGQSLAVVEEAAAGHPLIELLRFELEALEALPPGPPAPRPGAPEPVTAH
jgi:(p)ppGpp synthase/HD superfamily hydrolase